MFKEPHCFIFSDCESVVQCQCGIFKENQDHLKTLYLFLYLLDIE